MKIQGRVLKNDNIQTVVFPRSSGNIAFDFQPVLDWEKSFNAVCPMPKPPMVMTPGAAKAKPKMDDPKFQDALRKYAERKGNYMFLLSISATEGLEWETVRLEDPESWENVFTELEAAGFTQSEQNRMLEAYQAANSLDDDLLDKVREAFLLERRMGGLESSSSPNTEQQSIASGEPAVE
jgi:hypothetical protein